MQTKLSSDLLATVNGQKADKILRSCVHCGFCLPTCPTYQLLGNELDSPRGRIYLIKSALENHRVSKTSLYHLDRCLTCRACETTCPSGVQYGQLLGIGRELLEKQRPIFSRLRRFILRKALTTPMLIKLAATVAKHSPKTAKTAQIAKAKKAKVLLLSGCVQPSLAPNINAAAKQVLTRLGFEVITSNNGQCCGALDEHLAAHKTALNKIKHNLDNWSSLLDSGVSNIISTASGCGVMVKDYQHLFHQNHGYYQKAKYISENTYDIAEFLSKQSDEALRQLKPKTKVLSLHTPCTLYHGQQLADIVFEVLIKFGFNVARPADDHICCGSAGTYSILQSDLAKKLRTNKLTNLEKDQTDIIVTANIGCLLHLQKGTKTPVKHWIELLAN